MTRLFYFLAVLFLLAASCANGQVSVLDFSGDMDFPNLIIVGEGGDSGALFDFAAATYKNERGGIIYEVANGDDFVEAVMDFYGSNGPIEHLEYFGHGNNVALFPNQDIGVNGGIYANDPEQNADYVAASIYDLPADIFQDGGWMKVNGCNVADGYPERNSLAQDFANYFEVFVVAAAGPTEFSSSPDFVAKVDSEVVYMIPTYSDEGFLIVDPQEESESGFRDVRKGQSYEEAVNALVALGLDFDFENAEFLPYKNITYAEAAEFCAIAVGEIEKCYIDGYEPEEKIRNLQALRMLLDAGGIDTKYTDPWHDAYLSWAKEAGILTDDFVNKRWYTRGEMAELTRNFMKSK